GQEVLGLMDEIGIWNRAISSVEADNLYNAGAGLAYPFAAPPAAEAPISMGRSKCRIIHPEAEGISMGSNRREFIHP
ncbi:unnamed protein product, partial [marine sediment metagenome]